MSQQWKRFLGIGIESTWGTPVVPTAWLRFMGDDSLNMTANIIDLDGTEESRSKLDFADGDWICEGDISDIELLPGLCRTLFKWAMGTETGAGPYVFTLKDGVMPSATIELQRGATAAYQYRGMKVNSLSMSANARETVKVNMSLAGQRQVDLAVPQARTYLDETPFVFWQGTFKYASRGNPLTEVLIQSFSLELANNLRHPFMVSGRRYSIEQTEGVRDVTGSFRTLFDQTTFNDDSLDFETASLEYKFIHAGGAQLLIEFPRIQIEPPSYERGDQDYDQTINFRAFKSGVNREFKVTYTAAP